MIYMKIAFITTYDFAVPGGVRNHILALANELIRLGHDVRILAPSSRSNQMLNIPYLIPVADFPKATNTWFIPPHLLIHYRVIKKIQAILHQESFDLVHIHEPLLPPVCLSALVFTKSPLFATFHTYYEHGQPMYRLFKPLFNHWLKRLKGRITVSASSCSYINQYFPYEYQIIPNGVDVAKYAYPIFPSAERDNESIDLLFIGHAQFKRKGLPFLIEAYRLLKPHNPKLRLIIAGSRWFGRNGADIPADIPDIINLGMVDEEKLISLYQSATVFCSPAIGNESFGIVLIEAMAAGAPIVTTSIEGYANVVQHNHNALVVPPKDSYALAQAIQQLIDDPVLREQLIKQAKISVQQYSWDTVAKRVLTYYERMMSF